MVVSIYLREHEYLINEPQTLNLGGMYLYTFITIGGDLIVRRTKNNKYISDFFNISKSGCRISLLSAVVGENGVGKSSILDVIRKTFVQHVYSMPYNDSIILVEVDGDTKVLSSNGKIFMAIEDDIEQTDRDVRLDFRIKILQGMTNGNVPQGYKQLENVSKHDYQSIYYSPHFDLKYNHNFDEVDKYDISVDQYLKEDLSNLDDYGTNENGWKYALHRELVFKNSVRQIAFLGSNIYNDNDVFKEVFNIPKYDKAELFFRDVKNRDYHNTPTALRNIIELILKKADNESGDWILIRDSNANLGRNEQQASINKYLLERFVIKAFVSIIIQQMEKRNHYLSEGYIGKVEGFDVDKASARGLLFYFIKESYIKHGKEKYSIFNESDVGAFFEKLDYLLAKEINPDFISKQSIVLSFSEMSEVLELHSKIITNLNHYYPKVEGLLEKNYLSEGFISFQPVDRNMSSGETALLNFFSKLYNFIQGNLLSESKFLPDKNNYILLLDEADLGLHPIWKKKFIKAILSTIPHFFNALAVIPNLQIVITTHDSLTLSDLPVNNVLFLHRDKYGIVRFDDRRDKIQKTFGANITDLLSHSFFVDDGLIGDFARLKIKEVIDWMNESKYLSDAAKSNSQFKNKLDYYKKVIGLIDEKVIKLKLTEMITDLVPDNDYHNMIIDNEIEFLKNRKK